MRYLVARRDRSYPRALKRRATKYRIRRPADQGGRRRPTNIGLAPRAQPP
jgi:hypothetical protein